MPPHPPVADAAPRKAFPAPCADPLFVDTLRAALHAYEVGDYRRAADYFQDAAAVAGYRPEAALWATAGLQLEACVKAGDLRSRDASLAPAPTEAQ